jgi:putative transposase
VPTIAGFIYLAIVLDVWSRRIVGWAMSTSLETKVVLDALDMAIRMRQPSGVIHHSDQGCQYTSYAFGQRCINAAVRPSMGTVGDAYDNAMAESFFSILEHELLARQPLKPNRETELDVFTYIEGWYNPRRRHSALGYKSPAEFEKSASLTPVTPSP